MKNKIVSSIFSSLIILTWGIISGYFCIASLTLIDATEKVRIVERKVELSIVNEIVFKEKDATSLINKLNSLNPKKKINL